VTGRFALDYGTVRLGIAKSDPNTKVAIPFTTLQVSENLVLELVDLINQAQVGCVYVGLPLNLKGEVTKSAKAALELAVALDKELADVSVRMIDERFTSKVANQNLQSAGLTTRETKGLVDQAAALTLLTHALEIEERTGSLAGTPITDWIDR
jgi:putative Holliday junction resolvase